MAATSINVCESDVSWITYVLESLSWNNCMPVRCMGTLQIKCKLKKIFHQLNHFPNLTLKLLQWPLRNHFPVLLDCKLKKIWQVVPLSLLWCLWQEWNSRCFEGEEPSVTEVEISISEVLLWLGFTVYFISVEGFLDFLDFLELSIVAVLLSCLLSLCFCVTFYIQPAYLVALFS